jgi:hypothetical protein
MWRNLNSCFQQELSLLRAEEGAWVLPRAQSQSIDKLYDHFESIDEECSHEVNQAIRQWAASGMTNWPAMSRKARAMLRIRFETAEQLLHLLMLRQGEALEGETAKREWNRVAAARRILIDWWKDRGLEMGADIWVFQQWSRIQSNPRNIPARLPALLPVRERLAYAAVA